jgi:membrane dipeptidase
VRHEALLLLLCGCAHLELASPAPATQPPLALGIDTHLHVTMDQSAPIFFGAPGGRTLTTSPKNFLENQIDARGLRESGVRLALAALWPMFSTRPGASALQLTLEQLRGLHAFTARNAQFVVALSAAEAREKLARGFLTLIPQVEGGEGIEELDDVDRLWASGTRVLTVVHFLDNPMAGAAAGQVRRFFGLAPAAPNPKGLTALGEAAIARMMDLGVVIDLAHASDATSEAVLALTEARGVPVINSHGGARAFNPQERNVSDALALRIVQGGGTVGVTLYDRFVAPLPEEALLPGHVRGSCDDVIAVWRHLAKVVGPEALTLGSDLNGFITRAPPGGRCSGGLRNTSDLNGFFSALEASGVPRAALDGMGERFLKVLEAVEAKASPAARQRALTVPLPTSSRFDVAQ